MYSIKNNFFQISVKQIGADLLRYAIVPEKFALRPFRAKIFIIVESQGVALRYCLCPFRAIADKVI